MGLVESVVAVIEELQKWNEWQWMEPSAFFLLLLLLFALFRPVRVRLTLRHGDPWLFQPGIVARFAEGCIRYLGLLLACIALAALFLSLAYPVTVITTTETISGSPRVHFVVDTSGSVACTSYAKMRTFMMRFAEEKKESLPVAVGLYFFSGKNLLQMYPTTNASRTQRLIKRFGPACSSGGVVASGGYGAGMATEPGPSLWDAVLDAVRHSNPELLFPLKSIQDRNGLEMPGALSLDEYFGSRRDTTIKDLRNSVQGSRILFLTDLDFGASVGKITVQRVLELMALIQLRIDIISVASDSAGVAPFIRAIGGEVYYLDGEGDTREITRLAEFLKAEIVKKSSSPQKESYQKTDARPRLLLLVIAALFSALWIALRIVRPIIGW